MTRPVGSFAPDYFEALYASDPDPWRFASSPYEAAKYAATLAALPRERFAAGLEIGCSIGVLTRALASRCDDLLAIDVAETALAHARERCTGSRHVRFARGQVPGDWPDGHFDLILASEVLYYLDRPDLDRLAAHIADSLRPDGTLLLVHWIRETDYPLSGDHAVEHLVAALGPTFAVADRERTADYRLDRLTRA